MLHLEKKDKNILVNKCEHELSIIKQIIDITIVSILLQLNIKYYFLNIDNK